MTPTLDIRLIDRLVDGELDAIERRDTLLKLDATPDGWRQCALAFLEAQEFSQIAKSWTIENGPPSVSATRKSMIGTKVPARNRLAIAASILLLTFLAGFATRGKFSFHHLEVREKASPGSRPSDAIAVSMPPEEVKLADPVPEIIPAYVRSQWEQQGYQIEQKRKTISMELGNGGRVTIPFDDVEFRYVGRPIY